MLNKVAKFLLVSSSLSPVLGAIAVNQYSQGASSYVWIGWTAAALLLLFLCWAMLLYAATQVQNDLLSVREFERNDKEVLAFLLAYLLPFVSAKSMAFTGDLLTGGYILVIIFLVFGHAGAFQFNPVMGLLGYHFYAVKDRSGISKLLISKVELTKVGEDLKTVRLAHGVYLHIGGSDA